MYGDIIADQERCGFIEKVPTCYSDNVHYIPHHTVQRDSTTIPIRIVYECRCFQSPQYPNLNDRFVVDPPFHNDICAILLHFCCVSLSIDIEKSFLFDECD